MKEIKWVCTTFHLDKIVILKNSLWETVTTIHVGMSSVLHKLHGTCKYCKYIPKRM